MMLHKHCTTSWQILRRASSFADLRAYTTLRPLVLNNNMLPSLLISTSVNPILSSSTKVCSNTVTYYSTSNLLKEDTGSHSDFAPKRKVVVDDEEEALRLIGDQVKAHPVMLYMKGNPSMPMCGFSAKVVQILKTEGIDFSSVNVLDYPSIREGIKKYSDWPTIPQLYVNGEFIGGCDIVTSMHQSGELAELLKEVPESK